MLSGRELLAAVRTAQGIPSNYALAKLLDVREKDVSRWNTGANAPNDSMALRLARMANLDPAYVLASMRAQQCTDDAVRPVLERIAQRMQATAAAVLAAVLSVGVVWSPDAQARADAAPAAVVLAHMAKVTEGISSRIAAALNSVLGMWRAAVVPMVLPCST